MCLIDVPNLKEITPWEGYFYVVQKFFKNSAKKKNVKKIGQFLEEYISCSPVIRFPSNVICKVMYVYVEHIICKFDKNLLSSSQDTRG